MRNEQQPSWAVDGLLRRAMPPGARENPDARIGQTSWTWNKLKGSVQNLLAISGVPLNKREMQSGTYWLVSRIANQIGQRDDDDKVAQYIDEYVSNYLADKSMQRLTGKLERQPIYTREWWDRYFTPSSEDLSKGEDDDEDGHGQKASCRLAVATEDMVYVGIDGDDIGGLVEETLRTDDPEAARQISDSIHRAHKDILGLAKKAGGKVIFDGGDNVLLHVRFDPDLIESMRQTYVEATGHTATAGVGRRPVEAHYALVVGKNTGKNRTVVYSEDVVRQLAEIRRRQDELEPLHKQLKYRADSGDLEAGAKLKGAMWELGMPVTDDAVYDLLMRLVERFGLDDIGDLERFFDQDRESLKQGVREVHARRLDWSLRTAGRRMTDFEAQILTEDLRRMVEAATVAASKFEQLTRLIGDLDAPLAAAGGGLAGARERLLRSAMAFAGLMDAGVAVYTDQVREVAMRSATASSAVVPLTQAVDLSLRALDNAQVQHLSEVPDMPVDTRPVIERAVAFASTLAEAAMLLDLMALVAKADVRTLVADTRQETRERRMPGQDDVPGGGRGQRSPHRRTDWLTIEDYNRDQADWSKTDWYFVGGNVTPDEQLPVGGDQGPAIYVP